MFRIIIINGRSKLYTKPLREPQHSKTRKYGEDIRQKRCELGKTEKNIFLIVIETSAGVAVKQLKWKMVEMSEIFSNCWCHHVIIFYYQSISQSIQLIHSFVSG